MHTDCDICVFGCGHHHCNIENSLKYVFLPHEFELCQSMVYHLYWICVIHKTDHDHIPFHWLSILLILLSMWNLLVNLYLWTCLCFCTCLCYYLCLCESCLKKKSLSLGDTYMTYICISKLTIIGSLVQIIACCLVGAKPLSETMLEYIVNLTLGNGLQLNFNCNFNNKKKSEVIFWDFISRKKTR